jgi:general nucleoside transport system permease protein
MILDLIDTIWAASFWVAVFRIAAPLILGTLGVLLCERAGVLNLGIEGIMVAGAFTGWYTVYHGHHLWIGIAAAALIGGLFGLLHALLTVRLALSQHVAGLGLTLFATSMTYFAYRVLFPKVSTPPTIEAFTGVQGWLSAVPWFGPFLGELSAVTYLSLVLVALLAWMLNRTPLGLAIRMVGENPAAAESGGIDVQQIRTLAVVLGSMLMGVAGAFLTTVAFNAFFFNMINGRGWICIALVVFASWRPGKALLGALLFGFFDALQLRLQQSAEIAIPYQIYLMIPFVLSIFALIVSSRNAAYPQALMKPYIKGER